MAASVRPSASGTPPPQLLCISLHHSDRIRVMNLPMNSMPDFRSCIESCWSRGIQSEGVYGIAYEFKLRGNPWYGNGVQANLARLLVAGIFGFLLRAGWVLKLSTDVSKWKAHLDTFYFKFDGVPDSRVRVCALSFNMSDRIRVIEGPAVVVDVVRRCIHDFWSRGLQHEVLYHGAQEFKLRGNPWSALGAEAMEMRMFVGQLIEALDREGWEVYAAINIIHDKGSKDHPLDKINSWILRTKPSSVSIGIPVHASEPQASPYR